LISGNFIFGLIYHFKQSYISYKNYGPFWNDQNIIIFGRLQCKNLVGFMAYCANYFLIQTLAILTLYFAKRAQVNVGVIITLWNICPLFMAVLDFCIFGERLKCYHLVGTASIVTCCVVLSIPVSTRYATFEINDF
jgi:multidrug transporter EmrE-like cation transporter